MGSAPVSPTNGASLDSDETAREGCCRFLRRAWSLDPLTYERSSGRRSYRSDERHDQVSAKIRCPLENVYGSPRTTPDAQPP